MSVLVHLLVLPVRSARLTARVPHNCHPLDRHAKEKKCARSKVLTALLHTLEGSRSYSVYEGQIRENTYQIVLWIAPHPIHHSTAHKEIWKKANVSLR